MKFIRNVLLVLLLIVGRPSLAAETCKHILSQNRVFQLGRRALDWFAFTGQLLGYTYAPSVVSAPVSETKPTVPQPIISGPMPEWTEPYRNFLADHEEQIYYFTPDFLEGRNTKVLLDQQSYHARMEATYQSSSNLIYRTFTADSLELSELLKLFVVPTEHLQTKAGLESNIDQLNEYLLDKERLFKSLERHSKSSTNWDSPYKSFSLSRRESKWVAMQYSGESEKLITIQARKPKTGAFDLLFLSSIAEREGIDYHPIFFEREVSVVGGIEPYAIELLIFGDVLEVRGLIRKKDNPSIVELHELKYDRDFSDYKPVKLLGSFEILSIVPFAFRSLN